MSVFAAPHSAGTRTSIIDFMQRDNAKNHALDRTKMRTNH